MIDNFVNSFWKRVKVTDSCWLWTGGHDGAGRARMWWSDGRHYTARLLWNFCVSAIPAGKCICHTCDNPSCVNPNHLFLGSHEENMNDMARKGRSPHRKLSDEQVRQIRAAKGTLKDIAKAFGISFQHVFRIKNGLKRRLA